MGRADLEWGNNGMGAASPEEGRSDDDTSSIPPAPEPEPVVAKALLSAFATTTANKSSEEHEKKQAVASPFSGMEQAILSTIEPLPPAQQDTVRGRVGAHAVVSSPACPPLVLARQASGATDTEFTDLESGGSENGTLIEAHLVKDKEDVEDVATEVVHAEKMAPPSSTKRIRWLMATACLVIVVLVVSLVVALVQARKESTGRPEENLFGGLANPTSALDPSATEDEGEKPLTNTDFPKEDNITTLPCFQSSQELYDAMTAYYEDPTPNSSIAQQYGYPIGNWCISGLRNFAHVLTPFRHKTTFNVNLTAQATEVALYFHEDIGSWNLSNARQLDEMLWGVQNLSAHWGIGRWDVSKVHSFKGLFLDTHWTDPHLDLSTWNTSGARNLAQLFRSSSGIETASIGIDAWDTSKVENMASLAEDANDFNQDIAHWQTSKVTSLQSAFRNANRFDQPIGQWNTSSLTKLNMAFLNATSFNQPLGDWDVSQATTLRATFQSTPFNQDLSQWDVSRVQSMKGTFRYSSFNQDVSGWNVSAATELRWMFNGATSFSQDLCAWGSLLPANAKVDGMFQHTSCPNQSDPLGPQGPFCFNCN